MQRITGHNAATYDYDANGNITGKTVDGRTRTYRYNAANRLVGVDNQVRYDYNALGQRVSKRFLTPQRGEGRKRGKRKGARGTKHGHTRLFAYNEAGQTIGVYNHKGRPKEELIYFNGAPVASVRDGGEVYYVHTDHLGTPRMVTSETNDVVWRWESDPFGRSQPVSYESHDDEEFVFNLRFPGQYYDSETGLHYNYYRYYDPSTGRYMTSDPLKDLLLQFDPAVKIIPDLSKIFAKTPSFVRNNDVKKLQFLSENSYSYVKDNPVRWTDKFGLYTDCSYWGGSCTEKPDREPTYWECIAICNATLRFYCTAAAVCIGPKTFEGAKFSVQCGTVSGVYCAEQCKSLKK